MVRRTSLILTELLAMLFAGLIAIGGIAAYLLHTGPVSLDFMTPHLEAMLSDEDGRFIVDIDRTVVVWAGWRDAIDIRATKVSVTAPDGIALARVPELSLGLSLRALVRGRLAPTSLDAIGPRIRIVRSEAGEFAFGLTDTEPPRPEAGSQDVATPPQDSRAVIRFLIAELLADEEDRSGPFGYLRRVSILDGQIAFEDRVAGSYYRAPNTDVVLLKGGGGITGGAQLSVQYGARQADLSVDLSVAKDQSYHAAAAFQQVDPAAFAPSIPQLAGLTAIKMPLSGEISIRGHLGGRVDEIGFDFIGGTGKIELHEVYRERLDVSSLRIAGALTDNLNVVRLDQAVVGIGAATIYAQGSVAPDGDGRRISLDARVEGLPVNELHRYWPAWTHPIAHDWVASNIVGGVVDEGTVTVVLRIGGPGEEPKVSLPVLEGRLAFTGSSIHYRRPMTPIAGADGTATFNKQGFAFTITAGSLADDIVVNEGTVDIVNLDRKGEARLIVDATAEGPLVTALRVLDEEPLHYAGKMGFDPSRMDGRGISNLHFELPLVRNVTGGMLDVRVASSLQGVVADGPFGIAVTNGELGLDVTRGAMRVAGDVRLNGVPAALIWDENFESREQFRSRFTVTGRADDAARWALGLPDLSYWVQGPVDAELVYTVREEGPAKLTVRGDLGPALVKVEEAGWRKEPDAAGIGIIEGTVPVAGGLVFDSMRIETADMEADLALEFLRDLSNVRKVTIRKALFRGSDVAGELTLREEGGYRIDVKGRRLDVRHFLTVKDAGDGVPEQDEATEPFTVKAGFDEAVTGENRRMYAASFTGKYDGRNWESAILTAKLDEGADLSLAYGRGEGGYELQVESQDAGQALRTLDWWGEIQGGSLVIRGFRKSVGGPLTGTFEVYDFRMTGAPAGLKLLQLLTVIGLPAAMDESVPFTGMEGAFTYDNGVLTLGEVEAWGPVGVHVNEGGWLDFNQRRMKLVGVVVPANTVQGLIGKIPLLGFFLGDGLIATNFVVSGPLDKPDVNPQEATTLLPGFLRKLFRQAETTNGDQKAGDQPGAVSPRVQE
ncbi:MAG: AsmA-like C-terminal domain-containing protein [Alphaproteobacteria bacterium]|nr:AsmA-like C-terminal domain-containing protein [Alphaproteobacteria bacterium]